MKTRTNVKLTAVIGGCIWMPTVKCTKQVRISEDDFRYSDGSRPTARDMVLRIVSDGDFQSCSIVEGFFTFTRTSKTGRRTTTKHINVRQFPSVADCVFAPDEFDIDHIGE